MERPTVQILDRVEQQSAAAYEQNSEGTHLQIVSFVERLHHRYSDCQRYRLYHALVGSPPNGDAAAFVASLDHIQTETS